jgi:hypothetical protein
MEASELEGFSPAELAMIRRAQIALQTAGYDTGLLQVLVRADLPPGYRGMTWENGAVIGEEAFSSQAMLNHVLEEELLHVQQRASGLFETFQPGTARSLEESADEFRHFPLPES